MGYEEATVKKEKSTCPLLTSCQQHVQVCLHAARVQIKYADIKEPAKVTDAL